MAIACCIGTVKAVVAVAWGAPLLVAWRGGSMVGGQSESDEKVKEASG